MVAIKRRKTERTRTRRGERRQGRGGGEATRKEEGERRRGRGREGGRKRLMFALNPSRLRSKRLSVPGIAGMSDWNNRRVWWYG